MTEPAKCHCGSISWERSIEESRYICASCKRPLWQPIETAPKDGSCIIGYSYHEDQGPFYQLIGWSTFSNREPAWTNSCFEVWDGFTHWMPLPEGPKE